MAEHRRSDRVAEAIRAEVATFLSARAKDPRIVAMVTVTGVEVTRDLRHAKVFVSMMGDDAQKQQTLEGLSSLASYLRSHLGRALQLRSAPQVAFKLDESIARASRIESLLAQLPENERAGSGDAAGQATEPGATPDAAPDSGSDG
ncbi:MAG TPA: 30S ribosome-binding factor RbfA [Gemmatimonadaceae bacterium]|jgi:ribosome-binding factor A